MTNLYLKDVRHLDELDLYVLADLYDVKSHAVFHAIKKLICAGKRGAKDYEQDLMEAIESIERELQIMGLKEQQRGPHDHTFINIGYVGSIEQRERRRSREFEKARSCGPALVQECGFKPMHHEGLMPSEDVEPDWDRRHPSLRFAVKDEKGQFVFCKDQPSSGTFWIRPADFDEQRIDAIGQNGNDGEHYEPALTLTEVLKAAGPMRMAIDWTYQVDWMKASPHHQFAYQNERGDIVFSMHQPMGYDFIGRPTPQ